MKRSISAPRPNRDGSHPGPSERNCGPARRYPNPTGTRFGSHRRRILAWIAGFALLPAFGLHAEAQSLRQLPADALFGEFELIRYPEAAIDGKAVQLAAGAQIRDSRNLIVLPATIDGRHAALYRLDPSGQLWRVWMLAPEEIEAAKARTDK